MGLLLWLVEHGNLNQVVVRTYLTCEIVVPYKSALRDLKQPRSPWRQRRQRKRHKAISFNEQENGRARVFYVLSVFLWDDPDQ